VVVRGNVIGALVLAATLGCASPPQTRHYQLAPPSGEPAPASADGPSLAIEPLEVDAAYDEDRIVYRSSPVQIDYYHYHRWTSPPGRMLADHLRQAYRSSGRFREVTAEITPETDVIVSGRVVAIEEVDVSADRWVARIQLELRATDARSREVLWSREITQVEPMREQSPAGLARALTRALARVVAETSNEIAQSTPGSGSASSQGSKRISRPTGQTLR
jgi:ABC-type uncharacterized transport system auxiliary subunit